MAAFDIGGLGITTFACLNRYHTEAKCDVSLMFLRFINGQSEANGGVGFDRHHLAIKAVSAQILGERYDENAGFDNV